MFKVQENMLENKLLKLYVVFVLLEQGTQSCLVILEHVTLRANFKNKNNN
jgi:hypothetical protein